jgi:hypothetical protein
LVVPLASAVPTLSIVGNHDVERGCGAPFAAYTARFRMPGAGAGSGSAGALEGSHPRLWWSHDAGGVHWVGLSSYSPVGERSPQRAWLAADLAAVDRAVTPWVIVTMHAPWYNSNAKHQNDPEPGATRDAFEAMLLEARVDLVLAGHVHAYERSAGGVFAAKRNACAPSAFSLPACACAHGASASADASCLFPAAAYVVIGDGGNREGLATEWLKPAPEWSAVRKAAYGCVCARLWVARRGCAAFSH